MSLAQVCAAAALGRPPLPPSNSTCITHPSKHLFFFESLGEISPYSQFTILFRMHLPKLSSIACKPTEVCTPSQYRVFPCIAYTCPVPVEMSLQQNCSTHLRGE